MVKNGLIFGYDPGGNCSHGLTKLILKDSFIIETHTETLEKIEKVIQTIGKELSILAIGIDTLTSWSTGESGWRPAEHWLKDKYREVQNSVVSPNGLYGSMGLNGMAVLIALRNKRPKLIVTETHPKILFWALRREKYKYKNNRLIMNQVLATYLGNEISPNNEHEWDSAISAFVAFQGLMGKWKHDLHKIPCVDGERLIFPCGKTNYFWPE